MRAYPHPYTVDASAAFTDYTLTDLRGERWTFQVFPHSPSRVNVVSPTHYTRQSCTLAYHTTFVRDTLAQLPQGVVLAMFAKARVFDREYPHVVKPFNHDDGIGNHFQVGIRIRFTTEKWNVVMEREDARRLWGLLRTAR